MKPSSEFLQVLTHIGRHSPAYKKAYRGELEKLFNHYLKCLLEETKTNEKMMYSGRVHQLKDLLDTFDEAEGILLKRTR